MQHDRDRSQGRIRLAGRLRRFYADDIFISYSRADGAVYAAGLADALGKRGIACFLDQLGTDAAADVPQSLIRKLQSCTACVLVATAGASSSIAVRTELEAFKQTKRPIIPIRFDDGGDPSPLDAVIPGLVKATEARDALDTGEPSPRVIARIEKSFNYTKRNARMRLLLGGTTAVLTLLIGLIVWAGWTARQEIARSAQQTAIANAAAKRAEEQEQRARVAEEEATKQGALAQSAIGETSKQRAIAAAERKEADAQGRLASFRRAIAEAELERTQGSDRFIAPVQKALEAYQQYPSSEADPLLRYGLDRLPRLVASLVHPAQVTAVVLSPDGRYVSTLGADSTARMWEVSSAALVATVKYDDKTRAILSPDGQRLVVAGSRAAGMNRFALVFALREMAEIARLEHDAPLADVAFNRSGEYLATFSTDHVIKVNRLSSDTEADPRGPTRVTPVAVIQVEKRARFNRIVLSPDGRRVALVYEQIGDEDRSDYRSTFWDVATKTKLFESDGLPSISERGRFYGYSHRDTVWVKSITASDRMILRTVESSNVKAIAFDAEDELFATGSDNGVVSLYNLDENSGKELLRLAHQSGVTHVRFVTVAGFPSILTLTDGMAHLWLGSARLSLRDRQPRFVEAMRLLDPWRTITVSSNGTRFATRGGGTAALVWEKTFNGSVAGFSFDERVRQSTFSRDLKRVTIETDGGYSVWDTRTQTIVDKRPARGGKLPQSSPSAPLLGQSSDLQYSAVKAGSQQLQVLETGTGRILQTMALRAEPERVRFSARGRYMVVSTRDKSIGVWETLSGREIIRPTQPEREPILSGNEQYAALPNGPRAVSILELPRGRVIARRAFGGQVQRLSWSPDARFLVVDAERLWLWDRATGDIRAITVALERVAGAAFNPQGTRLLLSDGDGTLVVVNTDDASVVGHLKHGTRVYGPQTPPAAPSTDGSITVTGRSVFGYRADVSHMAFTGDGRYVATVATIESPEQRQMKNATIFVWDLLHATQVVRIEHEYEVMNASFTPDSRHLVVVGAQRIDHLLWKIDDVAAEARLRLAEWRGR